MNRWKKAILAAALVTLALVGSSGAVEAGVIGRVSVSTDLTQGDSESTAPSISGDGRYVALTSSATVLVPGDTNGKRDIFVFDTETQSIERVSVASDGTQGNDWSLSSSISADGRWVAFDSHANNLVQGDKNNAWDVFVHDRETGVTERVSVANGGVEGDYQSGDPSISADGRYVAFESYADNLVPGDTNGSWDIFVYDRQAGTTQRVSVASDGTEGNDRSFSPSISGNGRYVAFESSATSLVAGDTNGKIDIFVYDRQAGTTERVSVASDGNEYSDHSIQPSISGNGRWIAFASYGDNLTEGNTGGTCGVFVHDRETGTTTRASVDGDGAGGNGKAFWPSISADGRSVVFESLASNLVEGDANNTWDVFVRDLAAMTTSRLSLGADGSDTSGLSRLTCISADGRSAAFSSLASTLVAGDTNEVEDVFVAAVDRLPLVTSIDITFGLATGGTVVIITGTEFVGVTGPAAVTFGGTNAASYTVDSPTQITASAPPHAVGSVQIQVTTLGGATPDTPADDYAYVGEPTIGALEVAWGLASGGTEVIITGTEFVGVTGPAAVTFGGTNAASYTVDSPTQITAVAPPHAVGSAQVRVTAFGGATPDTAAGDYAYLELAHFEQTDFRLRYEGRWWTPDISRYSGGSGSYTYARRASVTIAFDGVTLDWIAKTGPTMGKARVSVDGGSPVIVDLYSSDTLYKQMVWSTGALAYGPHTVEILYTTARNPNSGGTAINIDAVEVMGTLR